MRTNGALKVSVSAHRLLELPYGRYPSISGCSRPREYVAQLLAEEALEEALDSLRRAAELATVSRLLDNAEQPEGVPEENWLPIHRGDEALDLVMRIYAPDLESFKTWQPPMAEKL